MTEGTTQTPEPTPEPRPEPAGALPPTIWPWAKVLRWSALFAVVVMALITIFAGLIPPLVVFAVLWLVGALLIGRWPKAAAILLLVVSVAFMLTSAPFVFPTLLVPESAGDFILNVASYVAAALATIAAVMVLRRRGPSEGARRAWLVGLGLTLVAIIVGVVAMLMYEDATPQEGDVELVTQDIEFSEDAISAEGGTVGVFVENKDATLHTFTIDELDVSLDIPANSKARVEFDAEPGTYQFYCVPHKGDMEGELEVG